MPQVHSPCFQEGSLLWNQQLRVVTRTPRNHLCPICRCSCAFMRLQGCTLTQEREGKASSTQEKADWTSEHCVLITCSHLIPPNLQSNCLQRRWLGTRGINSHTSKDQCHVHGKTEVTRRPRSRSAADDSFGLEGGRRRSEDSRLSPQPLS